MKTLGKFVLIDNQRKSEMVLNWGAPEMNRTQTVSRLTDMNYSARKTIISDLHPFLTKPPPTPTPTPTTFSQRKYQGGTSSQNKITPFVYTNLHRERPSSDSKLPRSNTTLYRTRSMKRVNSQREVQLPKIAIREEDIRNKVIEADKRKGKVVSVLTMKRNGLRYKLQHAFFIVCKDTNHDKFTHFVKAEMFEQLMGVFNKKVYLFHLGKEPINAISKDLSEKQFVVFADVSPKFNIGFDFQMKLFEQASVIEEAIRSSLITFNDLKNQFMFAESETNKSEEKKHQWQKIKNVGEYANKLIDNPEFARQMESDNEEVDIVESWCKQKRAKEEQKEEEGDKKGIGQPQKNPFFDVTCNFPSQASNHAVLEKVAVQINKLPQTNNKHQIKVRAVDNMMEKIKKEGELADELKRKEQQKIKTIGYKAEKQFLRELEMKNSALVKQNIPYIMEKYGINRAEAYNLYNLYKSLEKISAMRLFESNEYQRVKEKGIDRKTFDQGLKGLQINPGEELIRNICFFPEFISWEQFIKIVSISMRKTPMSKLEALLEGLGNTDDGYLSERQIDIMIGSSLHKIFGRDQPDLRKHFVAQVMAQMDADGSGTLQIDEIKDYVLKRSLGDMNIITYLMLNS